jgi:WD40 repeat protein
MATLFGGQTPLEEEVAMAEWNDWLALGSGKEISLWLLKPTRDSLHAHRLQNSDREERAKFAGLDLELIDWSQGRSAQKRLTVHLPPRISCMCAVGNLLAVGSSGHHAIHLLNTSGQVVSRLVGHAGGITSLLSLSDVAFFSGSSDFTVRQWNVQKHVADIQFHRSAGPVTKLAFGEYFGRPWLFSGDEEIVQAWDIRGYTSTFEVSALPREGALMDIRFIPESHSLVIVRRSKPPDAADDGKAIITTLVFEEPAS